MIKPNCPQSFFFFVCLKGTNITHSDSTAVIDSFLSRPQLPAHSCSVVRNLDHTCTCRHGMILFHCDCVVWLGDNQEWQKNHVVCTRQKEMCVNFQDGCFFPFFLFFLNPSCPEAQTHSAGLSVFAVPSRFVLQEVQVSVLHLSSLDNIIL